MNKPFVKLYRQSLHSPLFRKPKSWHFFQYCILKATWKDHTAFVAGQEVHMSPGQFIFGRVKACEETGLTARELRTSLNHAKATHQVTQETTRHYSVITVCNWETYQGSNVDSDTPRDTPSDQPPTHHRHTTDTVQEEKKGKKSKKTLVMDNEDAVLVCNKLVDSIASWKPDHLAVQNRKKSVASWYLDVDKAIRLEDRKAARLIEIVNWLPSHDGNGGFKWRDQIQSGAKLREKYDRLDEASKKKPFGPTGPTNTRDPDWRPDQGE